MNYTLAEMAEIVGVRTTWTDSQHISKTKDAVRSAWEEVASFEAWREFNDTSSMAVAAGTSTFALPAYIDVVYKMWDLGNDTELPIIADQELIARHVGIVDINGLALFASRIGTKGVQRQPSAATAITVFSSNSGDLSQKVTVEGITSDILSTVTIQLSGTASVTSAISFSEIKKISKSAETTGIVTAVASGVTLSMIAPMDRMSFFNWLRLSRPPDSAVTLNVFYRRQTTCLINDADYPDLPDIGNILIEGAVAHVLRSQRDYAKAEAQQEHFDTMLTQYRDMRMTGQSEVNFAPDREWLAQRRRW